jgi:hypothetical protein
MEVLKVSNEKEGLNRFDENRDEIRIKVDSFNSVDELITVGKENGIILSFERAQRIFDKMRAKNTQLPDDDLELVVGGCIELVVEGTLRKIKFY